MKKILVAGLIALLPTLLMAQNVAVNTKFTNKTNLAIANTEPAGDVKSNTNTAKTSRKAARESRQFEKTTKTFNQDFENASDVRWTSGKSDFVASFTKDDIRNMAWYSKGGMLLYFMRTYGAEKLPRAEQKAIRYEYDDYKITSVDEVHQNEITVYVVHLENDRNIKLVTVCDGAINVYREYKKM